MELFTDLQNRDCHERGRWCGKHSGDTDKGGALIAEHTGVLIWEEDARPWWGLESRMWNTDNHPETDPEKKEGWKSCVQDNLRGGKSQSSELLLCKKLKVWFYSSRSMYLYYEKRLTLPDKHLASILFSLFHASYSPPRRCKEDFLFRDQDIPWFCQASFLFIVPEYFWFQQTRFLLYLYALYNLAHFLVCPCFCLSPFVQPYLKFLFALLQLCLC